MQIYFILAFSQADIEFGMYTELNQGIETKWGSRETHALNILNNIYRQLQVVRVFNLQLTKGLEETGFKKPSIDDCVFYRDNIILIIYMDDRIITFPSSADINQTIRKIGKMFDIKDQCTCDNYIWVSTDAMKNSRIKLHVPLWTIEELI